MTDHQAIALGKFCGLTQFLKEFPQHKLGNEYVVNRLIEILNEYERIKNETDSHSISCGTKAILPGTEKQSESILQQ